MFLLLNKILIAFIDDYLPDNIILIMALISAMLISPSPFTSSMIIQPPPSGLGTLEWPLLLPPLMMTSMVALASATVISPSPFTSPGIIVVASNSSIWNLLVDFFSATRNIQCAVLVMVVFKGGAHAALWLMAEVVNLGQIFTPFKT